MKRGFTLVELMVVIGIMAIMGSLSVAGYRQMKRGMEERSVVQNVNEFINGAIQRAQIDRQSVAVYFWNETLQGSTGDSFEVVVGKAVAVRRAGRISKVSGSYLYDEFGDLEFRSEQHNEDDDSPSSSASSSAQGSLINLYKMSDSGKIEKSVIYETTVANPVTLDLIQGESVTFDRYAFELTESSGGATWNVGDAYGFEFADITLPHGYIFGRNYSKQSESPTREAGTFYVKMDGTFNGSPPEVNSLRPGSGGVLSPKSIGKITLSSNR